MPLSPIFRPVYLFRPMHRLFILPCDILSTTPLVSIISHSLHALSCAVRTALLPCWLAILAPVLASLIIDLSHLYLESTSLGLIHLVVATPPRIRLLPSHPLSPFLIPATSNRLFCLPSLRACFCVGLVYSMLLCARTLPDGQIPAHMAAGSIVLIIFHLSGAPGFFCLLSVRLVPCSLFQFVHTYAK
jgi:hypothetical protein